MSEDIEYRAEDVQVLRDGEHIRRRPGMYIGDTGVKGLHHLVYELIYNSVDEALAGYCKHIQVKVNRDGSITVADDGGGIPVDAHPISKRSALELVLTTVCVGSRFYKGVYRTAGGLHGVGVLVVNVLSARTVARVRRAGKLYEQRYERGKAVTELKELGSTKNTGTEISFLPDPEIFGDTTFDFDKLESHLREVAFLNKGLTIRLTDWRSKKDATFCYAGGVAQFVEYLNRDEETLHQPVYIDRTLDEVRVEAAFQYTTGTAERVLGYANNTYMLGEGTHVSGFRSALTRTMNAYGSEAKLFEKDARPTGEAYLEGLTGVVSVWVQQPMFESATKSRLGNPEVKGIVTRVVHEALEKHLKENPEDARRILNKVLHAADPCVYVTADATQAKPPSRARKS